MSRISIFYLVLLGFVSVLSFAHPSLAVDYQASIDRIDTVMLKTLPGMQTAMDRIEAVLSSADQKNQLTFELQKSVLNRAGMCISSLAGLPAETGNGQRAVLHARIRKICRQIMIRNEKTITFFQEHKLDEMEDPTAFFKSPQWQNPQFLISLGSYWLGWNGYYAGVKRDRNVADTRDLLVEAVNGFSRSIIDFDEEDVVLRSLLGRGLCQVLMGEYDRARMDFAAIKRRAGKEHPLYMRCLYEENRIFYLTGNLEMGKRGIDEIFEDYKETDIPPELVTGIAQLKSKILLEIMEKEENAATPALENSPGAKPGPAFAELRQLARRPGGVDAFYKYCRENADRLKHLPYTDIGPVGAMAVADVLFDRKDYLPALKLYLPVIADKPDVLAGQMPRLSFRAGYIHCRTENWKAAKEILSRFCAHFPDSEYMRQVVPLYFAAASNHYRNHRTPAAYEDFIASARMYVSRCSGECPETSDAYFQLGQYHEKKKQTTEARDAFSRVRPDSANFKMAVYHLLRYNVMALEEMKRTGPFPSEEGNKLVKECLQLIRSYEAAPSSKKVSGHVEQVAAHMVVMKATVLAADMPADHEKILKQLENFEKRFAAVSGLFPDVFEIRATAMANLGKEKALAAEAERFSATQPFTMTLYDKLKNTANDFYYLADDNPAEDQSEIVMRYSRSALILYDRLYRLSCQVEALKTNCDAIQLRMARLYINSNHLDEAEKLYQEILRRNSLSADALYSLGLLYEKKGQWEAALATWRRFSEGVKNGTYHWYEARYKTAQAFIRLGNPQKACDILTITMVLHPDFGSDELTEKYKALKQQTCKEK